MNLWTDSSYVKREADAEADAKADAEADAEAEADADRFYGAYLYPGQQRFPKITPQQFDDQKAGQDTFNLNQAFIGEKGRQDFNGQQRPQVQQEQAQQQIVLLIPFNPPFIGPEQDQKQFQLDFNQNQQFHQQQFVPQQPGQNPFYPALTGPQNNQKQFQSDLNQNLQGNP